MARFPWARFLQGLVFFLALVAAAQGEPCSASHVGHLYTKCTNGARSAVNYYAIPCEPSEHVLPDTVPGLPCSAHCDAGSVLPFAASTCTDCLAGTFSTGRFTHNHFEQFPAEFTTDCATLFPSNTCQPWRVNQLYLTSGNNTQRIYTSSSLRHYAQFFLSEGNSIRFTFQVDAESCRSFFCDGLQFYIDEIKMLEVSHQLTWKTVEFPVSAGLHSFRWTYWKDESIDFGLDVALIRSIELVGTKDIEDTCTECLPGTFTASSKSFECERCPANTFSSGHGATHCQDCDPGTAALSGSTSCFDLRACTTADYFYVRSSCNLQIMKETRHYTANSLNEQVPICDPNLPASVPPPSDEVFDCMCPPGSQWDGVHQNCADCPAGHYKNRWASYQVPCSQCGETAAALKVWRFDDWSSLPQEFTTYCDGDCGSQGWLPRGGYMSSGFGTGKQVDMFLKTTVTITGYGGEVRFRYSNPDCDFSFRNPKCFLQLYVDSNVDDLIVYDVRAGTNRTAYLSLAPGTYDLAWRYTHFTTEPTQVTNCQIFTITITGVNDGGAIECTDCPAGMAPNESKTSCIDCPPGTYSPNTTANCLPVPDGYFTDEPKSRVPKVCGINTHSSLDRTYCLTDCTFTVGNGTNYNISSLYNPDNMYFAGVDSTSSYFLNVCAHSQQNTTCSDANGLPLNTFACKKTFETVGDTDIGRIIGFSVLSNADLYNPVEDPETKGLVITLTGGDYCGYKPPVTKIIFICDSSAGNGTPQPKFTSGPEDPEDSCHYYFYWRSSVACPVCTAEDYQISVSDCVNGLQTISHIPREGCYSAVTPPSTTRFCRDCLKDSNGQTCSGRGTCQMATGKCNCATTWAGPLCDMCLGGYFGPECAQECPGGARTVCSGHGSCDGGTGGTGKCTCLVGFTGDACEKCAEGFEEPNCTPPPATLQDVVPWWGFFLIGLAVAVILGMATFFFIKKRRAENDYQILLTNQTGVVPMDDNRDINFPDLDQNEE